MFPTHGENFKRFKNLQNEFLVFGEIKKCFICFDPLNRNYLWQKGSKGVVEFNCDSIMELNVKLDVWLFWFDPQLRFYLIFGVDVELDLVVWDVILHVKLEIGFQSNSPIAEDAFAIKVILE